MEAMKMSGHKTKKATVHAALEQMVRSNRRKEFAKKMGKIEWEGNLDQMRTYDKWEENRNENEH